MDIEEIKKWYMEALSKYVDFEGRARRKELWTFYLVNIVVIFVLSFLGNVIGMGLGFIGTLFSLGVIIPNIAVGVRRFHDIGKEGWWILIGLVPFVGWIILIYFYAQDSEPGPNAYGPNPKGV